jgi:hypothetical protein
MRRRTKRNVLPSEKGLLEFTGRAESLPLPEIFIHFRDLVSADMDWTDSRKVRFRASAARVKVAALILTALSTIVLGIPGIPARASIALPMVATVTVLSSLEAFFNWRSRWVLMEEAQYRLNRLRDEIDYYLVVTPATDLSRDALQEFFERQQDIWADVSRRWIEFRKIDHARQGEQTPDLRSIT